jgi:enoyl-CoA hydratase
MATYENILVEHQGKTIVITINREDKLNALNSQTLGELSDVLDDILHDNSVRGVILTGKVKRLLLQEQILKSF